MEYEKAVDRKRIREGKTEEELLELFKSTYYRTERAGKLEDGCFVDIMITNHCNLNCSGCDHFAPIAKPYYVDLNTFEDQLLCLRKALPQANIITFWGGEALLHPNIKELSYIVRKVFSDADIMIGSNGILIEKLSEDTLDALHENAIGFQISRYLKDGQTVYTGLDRLERKQIHFSFSEYRNFFQMMCVDPSGSQDPTQWYTCSRCNMPMFTYRDYKLYKCAFGACSGAMAEKGIVIPEIEGQDYLYLKDNEFTQEDIFNFVFKPSNKCKYCKEVYINSGFVHQLNYSKKAQYLFDMKDMFMYYYDEYKRYNHNDVNMNFMKDHLYEEMAWDTNFNPMLDKRIKNRYYFGDYDIILELNDIDDKKYLTDILNKLYILEEQNNGEQKYIFYIIVNDLNLELEEEVYKTFAANFDFINSCILKKGIYESLLDVYKFIFDNSYSPNIVFSYSLGEYKVFKRENLNTLPMMNVSRNLPYYFDLKNEIINLDNFNYLLEKIFFEYVYIMFTIKNGKFDIESYSKFINNNDITADEFLLGFKILLLLNIKEALGGEYDLNIELNNIGSFINSNFLISNNLFITLYNHTTFDKDSLELKIISILNKNYDVRVLKVMNEYRRSREELDYFDKLLLPGYYSML